jgi:hypothetical protein
MPRIGLAIVGVIVAVLAVCVDEMNLRTRARLDLREWRQSSPWRWRAPRSLMMQGLKQMRNLIVEVSSESLDIVDDRPHVFTVPKIGIGSQQHDQRNNNSKYHPGIIAGDGSQGLNLRYEPSSGHRPP